MAEVATWRDRPRPARPRADERHALSDAHDTFRQRAGLKRGHGCLTSERAKTRLSREAQRAWKTRERLRTARRT